MSWHDETRRFYDETAQLAFDTWFDNPTLLPILKLFIEHLPDNPSVLDLGCGTGGESKRLSDLGARVTGIDFSGKALEYARKSVPTAEFLEQDIRHIDLKGKAFNGILEAAVLFHFNKTEQDRILFGIISSLTSGGIFLSLYPEGDHEGMQEKEMAGKRLKRYVRLLPAET